MPGRERVVDGAAIAVVANKPTDGVRLADAVDVAGRVSVGNRPLVRAHETAEI